MDGLEQFLFGIVSIAFGKHLADTEYKRIFQEIAQRI